MSNSNSSDQQHDCVVSQPFNRRPDDFKELVLGGSGVLAGIYMIQRSSSVLLTGAAYLSFPEPVLSTGGGLALISAGLGGMLAGSVVVIVSISLALGRHTNLRVNSSQFDVETEPAKEDQPTKGNRTEIE